MDSDGETKPLHVYPLLKDLIEKKAGKKMAIDDRAEILAKLDTLIKLQALSLLSRFESSKEKILFLSSAGLPPKQIADLLQTSSNHVSVTLSNAKKIKRSKNPN